MNHRITIHWCFPEAMSAKLPQASHENATAIRSRDLNAARIPKSSTSRPHLQSRSWRCWKCLCKALMLLAAISMTGFIGKTHKHHHQHWFMNIGVSLVKPIKTRRLYYKDRDQGFSENKDTPTSSASISSQWFSSPHQAPDSPQGPERRTKCRCQSQTTA